MIYFDTDVLINMLIPQDRDKHQQAGSLYHTATDNGQFFISLLCLQETAFVLQRLGQAPDDIDAMLVSFLRYEPAPYDVSEMKRGIDLARHIGFQSINDCLHMAIAENYCTELVTYNKNDFQRLKKYTTLKITVLP